VIGLAGRRAAKSAPIADSARLMTNAGVLVAARRLPGSVAWAGHFLSWLCCAPLLLVLP